ncbi:MAG: cysteine--tRNA ligase [Bdellovibrionales bacterium]
MPQLSLFNSLTREKQAFEPIDAAHVRLYACGPTVYNYAHIGNARMAVVFDVLARVLKRLYPKVTYVSNITDVDDKIMAAARQSGVAIAEITQRYTDIYNADMAALGCGAPDIQPLATTHIGDMIAMIGRLIDAGHAYEADGHVLFHVPSFPAYGGLSGRSRDEQIAGARVEVASYKRDPADFVLWKPSNGDEPGWDSPWGFGRPGWHIECSAMAEKHLGLPFDIHGGGADLKFPHHENEIAQSCCAHGAADLDAFAKYWVHNGFLTVNGEKMSKSLGNFLLAHDLLESQSGMVLRLALLSAHYRQPLDWSDQVTHQAEKLYARIKNAFYALEDVEAAESEEIDAAVFVALCDDLNTPKAFAALNDLITRINKAEKATLPLLKSILHNSIAVLGVDVGSLQAVDEDGDAEVDALLAVRATAKAEKNFARADAIRDQLAAQGIEIIDTPDGAKWRRG